MFFPKRNLFVHCARRIWNGSLTTITEEIGFGFCSIQLFSKRVSSNVLKTVEVVKSNCFSRDTIFECKLLTMNAMIPAMIFTKTTRKENIFCVTLFVKLNGIVSPVIISGDNMNHIGGI